VGLPVLRVRLGVLRMSRQLHRAPLAVTSDGTVVVNMADFDGRLDLGAVVERAARQPGAIFVGVVVSGAERDRLLAFMKPTLTEAASITVIGPRQRRGKKNAM